MGIMMKHGNYDRTQALFYLILLLTSSISLFICSLKGISGFYDNIVTKSKIATFEQVYVYMFGASFILFECLRILVISIISNNFLTKGQFKNQVRFFSTIHNYFFIIIPCNYLS
ncbi:hypothetical protein CU052_03655 [Vibrio harveyi]|nr:hypothetical protein CU052_03655 [Vibrio harveyi]